MLYAQLFNIRLNVHVPPTIMETQLLHAKKIKMNALTIHVLKMPGVPIQ